MLPVGSFLQHPSGDGADLTVRPKLKAMMDDARSDPDVSQKLEVFAFVKKALANLKAATAAESGN